MSNHYLITGGAGFIGSHLARAILAKGDLVTIFDNFSTGQKKRIPQEAKLIEASVTDSKALSTAVKKMNGIFHLAALPSVQMSIEKPKETHAVNVDGTLNVFLAAKDAGIQRVVYASSSAIYGNQSALPLKESITPAPLSPYGLHKLMGEQYAELFQGLWGMETASLRFFNVYGPGMNLEGSYSTVIGIFLKQLAQKKPLTITGDGKQTRDFVYIDDVVEANILAMNTRKLEKMPVMNIGSGKSYSVNDIAQILGGETTHIAPRVEPHDTLADIRLAQKELGWKPKIKFEDGLHATLSWFKSTVEVP
ncbi:MAG: NAD-dependent epimerase/dehydratase family protein [Patescibacteria group bacterium]|mgnify:CR=1 FL=1